MIDLYNYLEQLDLYRKVLTEHFPFDKQDDFYKFLSKNLEILNNNFSKYVINEYSKQRINKNIFPL